MSQMPGSIVAKKGAFSVDMNANLTGVIAELGYVPPVLFGALNAATRNLLDYHRRSVLKYQTMPNHRGGQRYMAMRTRFYSALKNDGGAVTGTYRVHGEGMARGLSFDDRAGQLTALEDGAVIDPKEGMLIPFTPGVGKSGAFNWKAARSLLDKVVADKSGFWINRPGRPPLLAVVQNGVQRLRKTKSGRLIRAGRFAAPSVRIVGVLAGRRVQRKRIGWYEQFDRVVAARQGDFDAAFGKALTAAGRVSLAGDVERMDRRRTETFANSAKRAARFAAFVAKQAEKDGAAAVGTAGGGV